MKDLRVLLQLLLEFMKIGAFTFGGGYAMIPFIERQVIDVRKWISHEDMVDILAVAQSVPGAIAINTSSFVGYKVAGYYGMVFATVGVILPSFTIISIIAALFIKYYTLPIVKASFEAISASVVALIISSAYKLFKKTIQDKTGVMIMILALFLLHVAKIHVVFVILAGGLTGIAVHYMNKFREV